MPWLTLSEAASYLGLSVDGVRKRMRIGRDAVEAGHQPPAHGIPPDRCRQDDRGHWQVYVEENDRRPLESTADPRDIEIVALRSRIVEIERQRDHLEKQLADRGRWLDALHAQLERTDLMRSRLIDVLQAVRLIQQASDQSPDVLHIQRRPGA